MFFEVFKSRSVVDNHWPHCLDGSRPQCWKGGTVDQVAKFITRWQDLCRALHGPGQTWFCAGRRPLCTYRLWAQRRQVTVPSHCNICTACFISFSQALPFHVLGECAECRAVSWSLVSMVPNCEECERHHSLRLGQHGRQSLHAHSCGYDHMSVPVWLPPVTGPRWALLVWCD